MPAKRANCECTSRFTCRVCLDNAPAYFFTPNTPKDRPTRMTRAQVLAAVKEMPVVPVEHYSEPHVVSEDTTPDCGACSGPLMHLGSLGGLTYYRCRNCGLDSHKGE